MLNFFSLPIINMYVVWVKVFEFFDLFFSAAPNFFLDHHDEHVDSTPCHDN